MKTFDEIIDECAKAQMVKWDINSFKKTHPSLYKVIITAMHKVKNCNTPAVSVACTECTLENSYWDGICKGYRCLECHEIIEVHER